MGQHGPKRAHEGKRWWDVVVAQTMEKWRGIAQSSADVQRALEDASVVAGALVLHAGMRCGYGKGTRCRKKRRASVLMEERGCGARQRGGQAQRWSSGIGIRAWPRRALRREDGIDLRRGKQELGQRLQRGTMGAARGEAIPVRSR